MSSGQPVFVDSSLKVDLDGVERYNDGDELRSKISRILDDESERERMAVAARATVLEKYSWDKVAVDYARAFEKLI